jgi:effector-binding domain-containing protein
MDDMPTCIATSRLSVGRRYEAPLARGNVSGMTHDVRLVHATSRPTAVVRATTTWAEYPSLWGRLLDDVWAFLRSEGCPVRVSGHNVMLYLDDVPHVEVGVEVSGPFPTTGRVEASELPAGLVAAAVHRGSYDGLDGAHEAVHRWCGANGYQLTRTRWEIYGDWNDDPSQLETEVFYLLT